MIRVDVASEKEEMVWGYANRNGKITSVEYDCGTIDIINGDGDIALCVHPEYVDYLIKALQECKKFVDSNK